MVYQILGVRKQTDGCLVPRVGAGGGVGMGLQRGMAALDRGNENVLCLGTTHIYVCQVM